MIVIRNAAIENTLCQWRDLDACYRAVEYKGFVLPEFWGLRNQICTTFGPNGKCERKVDF